MSQFLSNIINRHGVRKNIVLPRGKSTFERQIPFIEPLSSPLEDRHASINSASIPEEKAEMTEQKQPNLTTESSEAKSTKVNDTFDSKGKNSKEGIFNFKQNKESKREIGKRVKRIIDKIDLAGLPSRKKGIEKEESILNTKLTNRADNGQDERLNFSIDKRKLSTKSQQIKEQNDPILSDGSMANPESKVFQQLVSNLSIYRHGENNVEVNNEYNISNESKEQTIKIHIGRIDIKAVKQSPKSNVKTPRAHKASMSLEQFLKKREEI